MIGALQTYMHNLSHACHNTQYFEFNESWYLNGAASEVAAITVKSQRTVDWEPYPRS